MSSFTWDGVNKPEVYIDMVGQEIRPGDYIFYSVSYSSSATLVLGKLLAFVTHDKKGEPYIGWDYETKSYTKHYYKMHVQPLIRGRGMGEHRKVYLGDNSCVVKADVSRATLPDVEDN